jgi:AAA+ ATPase superfamily predicted ATPase
VNNMINPYITRSPVRDPDGFYGRDDIMKRIFRDIARKQMQSHCIIGERRIGKTSLLCQIMHEKVQKKYIKDIKSFVFVKTDIPLFPEEPPATFFAEWADIIAEISEEAPPEKPGYLSFRRFIERTTETGYRIIILLDDFEATIANENLDRGFFEFLRALTQNFNISFILFSRTPLQYFLRMEQFMSIFSSPFFNALNISYLKFLEKSDAENLIRKPSQKAGVDITDFTDFILEQAYYHPFLLQVLSSIIFDRKRSSDTAHEKILRDFRAQTEDTFTYLWKHSDPDEQEALKKLASKNQDVPRVTMDKLDRRSLLIREEKRIFSPSFEEFVRRQI